MRKSDREREKEEEIKRERKVFIMIGIEMTPHWGLLVSLYIQWQLQQFPAMATMQSFPVKMAARKKKNKKARVKSWKDAQ